MYSDRPVFAVIGKNYGDEGKGLATDYFVLKRTSCPSDSLVIRHNGGAQAGHTVDMSDGRRFVFHQLSSGSFRGASTLWADTFMPDLYKLEEELSDFKCISSLPSVYASLNSCPALIDDVLLNQALEDARGEERHGSCGMGINEAGLRVKAGYGVTVADFLGKSARDLRAGLLEIRQNYLPVRLSQIGSEVTLPDEYMKLLKDKNVIDNYIDTCLYNAERLKGVDDKEISRLIGNSSGLVFEGAQGLLLDQDYEEGAPNLTSSKTGLDNPVKFTEKFNLKITEVCYVSRSYVTRHGNGSLPLELKDAPFEDKTNVTNKWQGTLRYASHVSPGDFVLHVENDISRCPGSVVSLMLTHLNETGGKLLMDGGYADIRSVDTIKETFAVIYESYSPFAEEVKYDNALQELYRTIKL